MTELKKHTMVEQHCRYSRMLNEKHGYMANVETYINVFIKYIMEHIEYEQKKYVVNITDNIWEHLDGCFFEDVNIAIDININGTPKNNVSKGRINVVDTKLTENGLLDCLRGNFTFMSTYGDLETKLSAMFAHEILHAYEDWKRLTHDKEKIHDLAKRTNYYKNNTKRNSQDQITYQISNIVYYLTKFETSAYANTVYGELLKTKFNTLEDGISIVENMTIYKNYKLIGKWIENLSEIDNPNLQTHLAVEWGNATGVENVDYYSAIKNIRNIYRKQYKKFINTISKMIYDIYEETHQYLDEGTDFSKLLK